MPPTIKMPSGPRFTKNQTFFDTFSSRMPGVTDDIMGSFGYGRVGSKYLSPRQMLKSGMSKGAIFKAMPVVMPLFFANDIITGFKEGGLSGAVTGGASSLVTNVLASQVLKFAATGPGMAIVAGAAIGAGTIYAGHQMLNSAWQKHVSKIPLEFAGSTAAFNTSGAATMRQRSMQSIQRSYLNARSAFGNEAQYSHIAKYRGMR